MDVNEFKKLCDEVISSGSGGSEAQVMLILFLVNVAVAIVILSDEKVEP